MATVADELLNDFEDSGSEGEENGGFDAQKDGFHGSPGANGERRDSDSIAKEALMELDGGEKEGEGAGEDEDEEMAYLSEQKPGVEIENEEEAKQRVDKMRLKGVNDVRSVASLMDTLKPVLEVSLSPIASIDALAKLFFKSPY